MKQNIQFQEFNSNCLCYARLTSLSL